ncbi:MAG TPA: FeoB-associated Cys-rich membrane protein [Eubacteriaceae bacterium]|jgi:hypothetical protein|nr:FeoB-associated Cys-rich membrane protein [Eubacteriaceae bacterium]
MADMIILLSVLLLTVFIVIRGIAKVKKGECSCSEGCSTCSASDGCGQIKSNK